MTTIAMRRSTRTASRLTWLVDTRRKKIIATTAAVNLVVAALLALLGVWDSDSSRYWRRLAQDVVLAAADRAPAEWTPRLTRSALRVHRAGVTPAEMDRSARNFQRAGDRASAARLHLALARARAAKGNLPAAMAHAHRADQLVASPQALGAVVVLADPETSVGRHAIAQLQARYPESELSKAFDCMRNVTSFAIALPPSCDAYPLTREPAAAAVADHQRIGQELVDLPEKRAERLAWYGDWEAREYAEMGRLDYEMDQTGWVPTILQSVWETIKAQFDMSSGVGLWAWRRAICSIPIVRWICLLSDARLGPIVERQQRREEIATDKKAALRAWGMALDGLEYWNSSKPHDALVSEREGLPSVFRGEVYNALQARRATVGIDRDAAIDAVLRTPRR